ncbi:CLUMA_CG012348, isoform A [Clunio marinus]|uniref:CLUMA_CG012348, isoform A n=1 Tax=Clunio marinus TaxID=568069 RepID=A0A1J1IID8_9DIPT|nr:CLUMA_CG012348, isoform A [Clunio marinus]
MMTNKVKETLMVFYQNINGLGKKKDCLKDYSTKSSHDIYILTETKHRPGKIKVFKEDCFPENFRILRTAGFTKKSGNAQGGVLIAAAKTFNLKLNKKLKKKFDTKLVYAHPVCPAPRFQNFFVELSKIKNERQYDNFIIAGDFNYDEFYKYKVSNSSAISIQLSKVIKFENSTGIKMQCGEESLNDNGNMLDMIFCNQDIFVRNEPTVLQKSPQQHKSLIFNFKMERSSQEELLKLSMEKIISSFDIALKELEKCVKFSSAIDTRQMSDPIGPYVMEKLATINKYGTNMETKMETLKSAIRIGTQTNNNHSKSKRQDFDFPSSGRKLEM